MTKHIMRPLLLLAVFILVLLTAPVQAQDQRRLCKKFWPNVHPEKCMGIQESSRKKLASGIYYTSVVERCKSQAKIIDRKAVYTNYYAANTCAVKEQARVVLEEEKIAATKKDNAKAK